MIKTSKRRLKYIKEWRKRNKDKVKAAQKRYYQNHPDYHKIKVFLYGKYTVTKKGSRKGKKTQTLGLLKGNGCCLICFDFNPFHLQNHHPFKESEFQITLCAICHSEIHRAKFFLSDYLKEILVGKDN